MLRKYIIDIIRRIFEFNETFFFNRKLLKFYKRELLGSTTFVIDVGVNIGQSIELYKKLNKHCRIIGFEPNKTLVRDVLQPKYANNANVDIHNMGVSNKIGKLLFYENILHTSSSFEKIDFNSKYAKTKAKVLGISKEKLIKKSYEVPVTSLSSFIINTPITNDIDILKIDAEGHEYSCLEGLFNTKLPVKIKYIQLEDHKHDMYNKKNKSIEDMKLLLKQNGYSVIKTIQHGFGNFADIIFKLEV